MRYLLDTHVLLWARSAPEKISGEALGILQSTESELSVSIASLWECAIKSGLGKLIVPENFFRIVASDYTILGIDIAHLQAYRRLPVHHRDPFDRMLIVQARLAGLTLLTHDANIARYDVPVVMVRR